MHPPTTAYSERPSTVIAGAVVWTRTVLSANELPVLPDGCMDLLWMDGRLRVAGPDSRAASGPSRIGTRVHGMRFFPGTAPALLGVPGRELRDTRVELDELWPAALARRSVDTVAAAADPLIGLEAVAFERAAATEPPDPVLPWIVTRLGAGDSVAEIADAAGFSERQLRRMSLSAFGYGPKTLGRILRLQRALALIRAGKSFAETAAHAGYADQPHLARDVREFAGMPLRQLLSVQECNAA
ncbi:helix-turn-helix transcriptional regulator [Nocardia uniformis]|uniref:Helix-turn-helix transcriptional regulator n=1 Tax=Nocardia uniformis TaxID=53432 RepID=A0A849C6F8_9NOCA|nr:helix-turn-helix transcriptional regulator [Nocardia uniformis]